MRTVVEKLAGDAVAKMFIHREILIFGVYGGNMSTMETEVSGAALHRKLVQCVQDGKQSILSKRILHASVTTCHLPYILRYKTQGRSFKCLR